MKYILSYILACLLTVNAVAQNIKSTVAVPGGLYSTSEKYISDTNRTYYTTTDRSKIGVVNMKRTWWRQVIKKTDFKLGANDSYSRATASYSGYNDEDYTDRSFIVRISRLGNPDIILIFGRISDNWTDTPVGEYKYRDFKRVDLYTYRPALAKLIEPVQERYPNATPYFIVSDNLKTEIVKSTKVVYEHYGIRYVQPQGIKKEGGCLAVKEMEAIVSQVLTLIK